MGKQDLVQQFITTMTKLRQLTHQGSKVSLEEKFATILQMQALRFLKEHSRANVGELADFLHMSSPAIAQLCDRIVENDWVRRENDKKDKRITHLIITIKGEKELIRIHEKYTQKFTKVLSLLSKEDLGTMTKIMVNLVQKIDEQKIV